MLVGHSLGAGVCELLAVLLLGGAKAGEVPYTLPEAGRGRFRRLGAVSGAVFLGEAALQPMGHSVTGFCLGL